MKIRASSAVCAIALTITCNGLQMSFPSLNTQTNVTQFQATQNEKNLAFHMMERLWKGKGILTSATTLNFQYFCKNVQITENCEGAIIQYAPLDFSQLWPLDTYEMQMMAVIWGGMFTSGSLPPASRFPLTMMPQYERTQRDP